MNGKMIICFVIVSVLTSMCIATHYEYDNLNRLTKATYSDGTRIIYGYDASGNRRQMLVSPLADVSSDGKVDFEDFAAVASAWLQDSPDPSMDVAPWPGVDGRVDFTDVAMLAEYWLDGVE